MEFDVPLWLGNAFVCHAEVTCTCCSSSSICSAKRERGLFRHVSFHPFGNGFVPTSLKLEACFKTGIKIKYSFLAHCWYQHACMFSVLLKSYYTLYMASILALIGGVTRI